jgi:Na+/H+ antiporter NhaD/arsenite permease-like protein
MINNGFTGSAHVNQWMMLAAASTISGNLTILAAASNIIIIEKFFYLSIFFVLPYLYDLIAFDFRLAF